MKMSAKNKEAIESKIRYYIGEINYLVRSEKDQGRKFTSKLVQLTERYEMVDGSKGSLIDLAWGKVTQAGQKFK